MDHNPTARTDYQAVMILKKVSKAFIGRHDRVGRYGEMASVEHDGGY